MIFYPVYSRPLSEEKQPLSTLRADDGFGRLETDVWQIRAAYGRNETSIDLPSLPS